MWKASVSKIQLLLTVLTSTCNSSSTNTAQLTTLHNSCFILLYLYWIKSKALALMRVEGYRTSGKDDRRIIHDFVKNVNHHMLGVQFRTSLESKLWTAVVRWNTTENSVSHNSPCILLTGHAKIFLSFSPSSPYILICYVGYYYNVLFCCLAEACLEILCYES